MEPEREHLTDLVRERDEIPDSDRERCDAHRQCINVAGAVIEGNEDISFSDPIEPSALLERNLRFIEDIVRCPVCMAVSASPPTCFSCGHLLCWDCLQAMLERCLDTCELEVSCPVCRARDPCVSAKFPRLHFVAELNHLLVSPNRQTSETEENAASKTERNMAPSELGYENRVGELAREKHLHLHVYPYVHALIERARLAAARGDKSFVVGGVGAERLLEYLYDVRHIMHAVGAHYVEPTENASQLCVHLFNGSQLDGWSWTDFDLFCDAPYLNDEINNMDRFNMYIPILDMWPWSKWIWKLALFGLYSLIFVWIYDWAYRRSS